MQNKRGSNKKSSSNFPWDDASEKEYSTSIESESHVVDEDITQEKDSANGHMNPEFFLYTVTRAPLQEKG